MTVTFEYYMCIALFFNTKNIYDNFVLDVKYN